MNDVLLGQESNGSRQNFSPVQPRITSDFALLGKSTPIATSALESDLTKLRLQSKLLIQTSSTPESKFSTGGKQPSQTAININNSRKNRKTQGAPINPHHNIQVIQRNSSSLENTILLEEKASSKPPVSRSSASVYNTSVAPPYSIGEEYHPMSNTKSANRLLS